MKKIGFSRKAWFKKIIPMDYLTLGFLIVVACCLALIPGVDEGWWGVPAILAFFSGIFSIIIRTA